MVVSMNMEKAAVFVQMYLRQCYYTVFTIQVLFLLYFILQELNESQFCKCLKIPFFTSKLFFKCE